MTSQQQSTARENYAQKISASLALSPERSEGLNYLEQLTELSGQLCPNPKCKTLLGVNHKNKKAVFLRMGCKQWSCSVCGAKNGRKWLARMLHGMTEIGGIWSLVTFTAHKKWRGKASLKNIKSNWSKLRKRLARAWEGELYYFWVYEQHKDRSWHVHMLTNASLGSRWWKDNSAECGMGHQCKSIELENYGMAAGYVAKYLLKQMVTLTPYPKNMRRITTSRNFPQLPPMEKDHEGLSWSPMRDKAQIESLGGWFKDINYDVSGMRLSIKQIDKYSEL